MISTDSKALELNSAVADRLRAYGALVDRLEVIVLGQSLKDKIDLSTKVTVYSLGSRSKFFWLPTAFKLAKSIEADVITCQDPFFAGWLGWRLSYIKKIPFEIQVHTDFLSSGFINFSLFNRFKTYLALWLLPKASGVRVVSEQIKKSMLTSQLKLKCDPVVLPIFVDYEKIINHIPAFDLHQLYPQFDKIIVLASRLTRERNLPLAVKVFKGIYRQLPRTGLVIVGDGPERFSLENLINKLNLNSQVKFKGWQDDVLSYFKTADLFLQTSVYEGYGLSLLQAIISGCPAVSTPVGIANDYPNQVRVGQTAKQLIDNSLAVLAGPKYEPLPMVNKFGDYQKYCQLIVSEWQKIK